MYDVLISMFVGVVLVLNGLWMLNKISDKEILAINCLVGLLTLAVAVENVLGGEIDEVTVSAGTLTLLFSTTYLWVAYNRWTDSDGRGLGWYSLIVAIVAAWVSVQQLMMVGPDFWSLWRAVSWVSWSILWFLFFLLLVVGLPWTRIVGWISIVQGVGTGLIPGLLMLRLNG